MPQWLKAGCWILGILAFCLAMGVLPTVWRGAVIGGAFGGFLGFAWGTVRGIEQGVEMVRRELLNRTRWISRAEGVPTIGVGVLTFEAATGISIDKIIDDGSWVGGGDPTHWAVLPDPPQGAREPTR